MDVLGVLLAVFVLGFLFLAALVVLVAFVAQKSRLLELRIASLEEALTGLERRSRTPGGPPDPPGRPAAHETIASRPPAPPVATPLIVPPRPFPAPPTPPASISAAPAAPAAPSLAPAAPSRPLPSPGPSSALPAPADPSPEHLRGEPVTLGALMREPAPATSWAGGAGGSGSGSSGGAGAPSGGAPPSAIDWERYIGIRGAAVLGGIVLAIAGLLLFQYSIQHGWITPLMRVVTGIVVGLGCIGVSQWLKAREYRYTPEATTGAGIVILYAAFWAAYSLYALIGLPIAFGLMTAVTIACCLLSLRHGSQIIAVLGLVGGFATPLILHSDVDRPIGLFGYALLLDLGLLAIGRAKRWPVLGILSVGGTLVLQIAWIGTRMTPDRFELALGILAVFAIVFSLGGDSRRDARGSQNMVLWIASQACGVLVPFLFALYFASRTDLGPHLYPLALLLGLLIAGSGWIARKREIGLLGAAGAAGALGVVAVWMVQRTVTPALGWEVVGVAAGLVTILQILAEFDFDNSRPDGPAAAAVLAIGGFLVITFAAAGLAAGVGLWPWLALWLFLAAILYRLGSLPERAPLTMGGAIGTGLGLAVFLLARGSGPLFPGWTVFLGVSIGISALAAVLPWVLPTGSVRAFAARAGALLPAILLFALGAVRNPGAQSPVMFLGGALAFGVLAAWPSAAISEGVWMAIAGGLTAYVHTVWTADRFNLAGGTSTTVDSFWNPSGLAKAGWTPVVPEASPIADAHIGLLVTLVSLLLFTAWPFIAGKRLASSRTAWFGAALAAPVWFPATRRLFVAAFGDGAIGALPVGLALLGIAAAVLSYRTREAADPLRESTIVAFSAAAFGFVTLAVPLQFSNEWITIGWALEALAALALWTRLDHPGFKYAALGLAAAVSGRLLLNPEVLSYHPRAGMRILNWITITYLVPAAAMFASAWILRGRETARARGWESNLYASGRAVGAIGTALAAIFVVFAWLNLTVLDWFATGPQLTLHLAHIPAADLTLSIAWALYALVLLGVGMAGGSQALRWLSLCFLVLTIGKVFLYDLGQLQDLYRVASLAGLAVSLLLVSLLYQRFVFRKR